MRILIATGLYPPDIGGPATYATFLERHLPLYGFSVNVVSFGGVRNYPPILRHVLYTWHLLKQVKNVDCIYALDTISVGLPACLVSFITRKPLYLRVPGDYAWEQGQQRFGITETLDTYLETTHRPVQVSILAWLQSRVAKHARKIIVPSEYMKGVVAKWGIDTKKIVRIYSAFPTIQLSETKEQLRSRFGYNGFIIITAARLVPWKGIEALIDTVKELHESGMQCSLEIVGEGTLYDALDQHIQKHNAQAYIFLRGKLDTQALGERIKASDVFVLNTSYEGLSHQLLEVMGIGVPIVTTPVGGNVELITHGTEGLLVPFNDVQALIRALTTMNQDVSFRESIIENAREKVKLFREEVIIPDIVKLFSL